MFSFLHLLPNALPPLRVGDVDEVDARKRARIAWILKKMASAKPVQFVFGGNQIMYHLFIVWIAARPSDLLGEGWRIGVFVILDDG